MLQRGVAVGTQWESSKSLNQGVVSKVLMYIHIYDFYMFTPTRRDDPICLIFFGWVGSTTNYLNHSQYVSADGVGLRTVETEADHFGPVRL